MMTFAYTLVAWLSSISEQNDQFKTAKFTFWGSSFKFYHLYLKVDFTMWSFISFGAHEICA